MNKEELNTLKSAIDNLSLRAVEYGPLVAKLIEAYEKLANREPDLWNWDNDNDYLEFRDSPEEIFHDNDIPENEIIKINPVFIDDAKYAVCIPVKVAEDGMVLRHFLGIFDTLEEAEQAVKEGTQNG